MPTKKRQTMGKVTRERELKERRALKQEKKDARKAEAAERAAGIANGTYEADDVDEQTGDGGRRGDRGRLNGVGRDAHGPVETDDQPLRRLVLGEIRSERVARPPSRRDRGGG